MELSIKSFKVRETAIKYCHEDDHFLEALYLAKDKFLDSIDTESFEVKNYINEMKARYTNEYGVLNRANLILDELENATNYYKDPANFDPVKKIYTGTDKIEYYKSVEDWSKTKIDIIWNRFESTGILQSANDTLDIYAIYLAYDQVGNKNPDIEGLRWWYNVLPTDANGSKVGNVFDMNDPIQAALINGLWNDKFTPKKIEFYNDRYGENAKYFLDLNERAVNTSPEAINNGYPLEPIKATIDYIEGHNKETGASWKYYLMDDGRTNLQEEMRVVESYVELYDEYLQRANQVPDKDLIDRMRFFGGPDFSGIFSDTNLM
jgi:hypothetical protein